MRAKNNATSPSDIDSLVRERSARLQADYQAFLIAPMATLFDAFANDERFCQLIPKLQGVTMYQSAQGLTRRCDFGNDLIVDQRIEQYQPPSIFAYAVVTPNPLGLRKHYAEVTCQPHGNGTRLRWQHYFEHDDPVAMLKMLNEMFEQVLIGLFAEFEGQRLS